MVTFLVDSPEERHVSVDRFKPPPSAGAVGESGAAPGGAARGEEPEPWLTHDLYIPPNPSLGDMLSAHSCASGHGGGGSSSSGWSELDQEVARLAHALSQLRCACDITVVDYCRTRTRFVTGAPPHALRTRPLCAWAHSAHGAPPSRHPCPRPALPSALTQG